VNGSAKRDILRLAAMGTVLLLAACAKPHTADLKAFVAKVESHQHGHLDPIPAFKPYETFIYQASNLRSPFQPPHPSTLARKGGGKGHTGIHPDTNRPREPLEEYPLDTLRMAGTLSQSGHTWGLVRAPDGTIHRVAPGNHAGQNNGRITRITDSEIDLLEIVPDGLGGWIQRPATLALSD